MLLGKERWLELSQLGSQPLPALPQLFPRGNSEETPTNTLGAERGYWVSGGRAKKQKDAVSQDTTFPRLFHGLQSLWQTAGITAGWSAPRAKETFL